MQKTSDSSAENRIIFANRGENPVNESFLPKELISDINFFQYPNANSDLLRSKLAHYTGYTVENIACTNGSDEALILLIQLFATPNEEIIMCPPTFFNYEKYITQYRAKAVSIVRNEDFSLNMTQILSSITPHTKLIMIDSPGNPCGALVSKNDIETLLKTGVPVLIDEAYFEYCNQTAADFLKTYPNIIITRSFSKWAGLAGLRVGYVIARENIISKLQQIKLPYNVNAVGQHYASYILDHKEEFLNRLNEIISLREEAISKLKQLSEITVYSSNTAFIVINLHNLSSTQALQKFMEEKRILIMVIEQPLLKNCIRVNFSNEEDSNYFCSMLKEWIDRQKTYLHKM